jgi:adenine deaminase
MDFVIRSAIAKGISPVRAVRMATINTTRYFGLQRSGAIAPGYFADFCVIDDLQKMTVREVYFMGKQVAAEGKTPFTLRSAIPDAAVTHTMNPKPFSRDDLILRGQAGSRTVIRIVPNQILTEPEKMNIEAVNGALVSDIKRDILKAVVIERHKATGRIGLGFCTGFNLQKGALAQSVAHDAHNLVAVGADDADLHLALKTVVEMEGGIAVAAGGTVVASLPLPLAGLMALGDAASVAENLSRCHHAAAALGCKLKSPFQTLSFISIPVIPKVRLTDRGLVDVFAQKLIE